MNGFRRDNAWTGPASAMPRRPRKWGRRGSLSDADAGERREAVEVDRRVGGGIGAGREDPDPIARPQGQGQATVGLLVENVCAVAGRTSEHDRRHLAPVMDG